MSLSKNDLATITIEDIGTGGEGIGKIDGYTLFVKDAIIGDTVEVKVTKAKKNYGYGRLMNIIAPSKDRVEPVCPVARQCGGCQIQEMSYESQLSFKQNMVKNNLARLGGLSEQDYEMYPIIGMDAPFHYRNKAQYPVGKDSEGNITMGFYAGRTHSIIDNTDCSIGAKGNKEILEAIKDYMMDNDVEPYNEVSGTGLIRHVLIRNGFQTGEVMVCLVINGDKIPFAEILIESLEKIDGVKSIMLNINKEKTNIILGKESKTLSGTPYIEDYIGSVKYQISPVSFFQINPEQTTKLYDKALEFAALTGNETVWDLYCGIGTISLFLAQKAKKVYGVEIVAQAIEDANNNAKINGIENAEFFVGKSEEVLPEFYEKEKAEGRDAHADVIVVDPPRKGCDEVLLSTIVKMQPDRMVYVSCDSATLARDLKFMAANGYQVEKVQPVDQFAHSVHVETVACLHKVNS